jgi:hypothetical protein
LSSRAVSAELGCLSLYEFRTGGALSEGSVHLVSDGQDTQLYKGLSCGAEFQAMDASGGNVLFTTADPLLSGDTDGFERDIYDAREGGGFPLAPGGESGVCGSVSCEVPGGGPPVLPVAGSTMSAGEAGLPPVVKAVSGSSGKKKAKVKAKKKVKKKAKVKVKKKKVGKGLRGSRVSVGGVR